MWVTICKEVEFCDDSVQMSQYNVHTALFQGTPVIVFLLLFCSLVTTPGNVWTNPIKSHPFLPVYEFAIPLYWFYIKFRGRGRVKGGD